MYAIVDIETTGGHASTNGITEICIFIFDGEKVINEYQTLINPGMEIPRFIESLTGISNEMVATAPYFNEVAHQIYTLLKDNIFVAHNVNFDYSFIKHSLGLCGFQLNTSKLCTVRLSRKIIPGYASYSLGNLCGYLNIPMFDRHRAKGDAAATVKLFEILLEQDSNGDIEKMLKKGSKEQSLPPNLPKQQFEKLPSKPGIYYFHNQEGKIVYIGKAINIKSRVSSHFSNNSTNKQKQDFLREIHSLSFEETSTELLALILESHEIKAHWPAFNKAQKKYDAKYGLYDYIDRSGIIRLGIEIIGKHRHTKPLIEYSSKTEAIEHIQQMVEVFELCPQFCGVQQVCINSNCDCKQPISLYEYNAKVNDLIVQLSNKESYLIIDKGRTKNEFSAIYVSKGKFIGMGYIPVEVPRDNLDEIIHFIKKYKENFFILKQIELFALANPEKVIEVTD